MINNIFVKVLVTGSSGFVGRALVEQLQQNDFEVITSNRKAIENLPSSFPADVTDAASFEKHLDILSGTEVIVHSAGLAHQFGNIDENEFYRVNAEGTRNVAELAVKLGTAHFVLISSISVYGRHGKIPVDETKLPIPRNSYAKSKLIAEQAAREICQQSNIKLTILRLATVYGEGDRGNINRLINLLDKNRFVWIGNGRNLKSLIYRKDAARAVCAVIKKPQNGTYNLVGQTIEMREIVENLATAIGKSKPVLRVPKRLPLIAARCAVLLSGCHPIIARWQEMLEKWLSDDAFSGERLTREFNFEPEIDAAEGLLRQVEDYQRQKGK